MGIQVRTVFIGTGTMPVAQMHRNLALTARAHIRQRGIYRGFARIRLGRERVINSGLSQIDPALRIPNDLGGLKGSFGHQNSLGISVAYVLGSGDKDATGDELGILTRIDHAS